jgi:limonene 1,2-monooxygenase
VLFRSHEWANREATLRSYELFARWVMPRFQGSVDSTWGSREWCSENRAGIFGPAMGALRKAFVDAGQDVPDTMRMKLHTGKTEVT